MVRACMACTCTMQTITCSRGRVSMVIQSFRHMQQHRGRGSDMSTSNSAHACHPLHAWRYELVSHLHALHPSIDDRRACLCYSVRRLGLRAAGRQDVGMYPAACPGGRAGIIGERRESASRQPKLCMPREQHRSSSNSDCSSSL